VQPSILALHPIPGMQKNWHTIVQKPEIFALAKPNLITDSPELQNGHLLTKSIKTILVHNHLAHIIAWICILLMMNVAVSGLSNPRI